MKKFSTFMALAVGMFVTPSIAAEKITPSHVYQLVDYTYAELASFHGADFSSPPDVEITLSPRKPRHVLQKAQEAYIKVQKLRRLNGLSENPVKSIPVRAVVPADVRESVQRIADDLVELREIYGVEAPAQVELPQGKKPTDVYRHLVRVSTSLDHLGLPAVVPNDVYRVAQTIVLDLEKIMQHQGNTDSIPLIKVSGKKPPQVYDETYVLLQKLADLTKKDGYQIPGGVVLPPKPTGKIKPLHVMNGLGDAMAEIGAIKYKIGMNTPTKFAPPPGGKTPSDVFAVVKRAQAMVDALSAENSAL